MANPNIPRQLPPAGGMQVLDSEAPIDDGGLDADIEVSSHELSDRETRRRLMDQIGTVKMTAQQREKLRAPLSASEASIKPTGEVFVSGVHYRRRLFSAFTSWGLRPMGGYQQDMRAATDKGKSILYREYALVINGKVASIAIGEQEYHPKNSRMTYGDAAEGVRTNALTRCCKDLGLFLEVWDRSWTEQFKRDHCVQVWLDKSARGGGGGDGDDERGNRPQWRRLDAEPLLYESGVTDTSPNRAAWFEQRKRAGQPAPQPRPAQQEQQREQHEEQQERPRAAAPSQAQAPAAGKASELERVLACRVNGKMFCVKSTVRTYWTKSQELYKSAEQLMQQQTPVEIVAEERADAAGTKFWFLVEFVKPGN